MTQWVFLNHQFVPTEQATISIMDRGLLFGDSVYEVVPYYAGKPLHLDEHLQRLQESLTAIRCLPDNLPSKEGFVSLIKELLQKNDQCQSSALIYIQITRGVEQTRSHALPDNPTPTIIMFLLPFEPPHIDKLAKGLSAITMLDQRWAMCHIKTTALLGNLMLLDQAHQQHVNEGIFIRDGYITESTSSNIFIVQNETVLTPVADHSILNGITRRLIIDLVQQAGFEMKVQPISESQLLQADEIWLTSASKEITPVLNVNHKPVGEGYPGLIWQQMIKYYQNYRNQLPKLFNER